MTLMRTTADDICPICRDSPKDIYLSSCGHAFCGRCICSYLHRAVAGIHGKAGQSCPVCRQQIRTCTTTAGDSSSNVIQLQLGKVLLQVDLPTFAAPTVQLDRICRLFDVKASSIKLIFKGRQVGAEQLGAICSSQATAILLPVRPPRMTLRLQLQRIWSLLLAWTAAFTAWPPLRRAQRLGRHVYGRTLGPLVGLLWIVVASVNPEFRAPQPAAPVVNQPAA